MHRDRALIIRGVVLRKSSRLFLRPNYEVSSLCVKEPLTSQMAQESSQPCRPGSKALRRIQRPGTPTSQWVLDSAEHSYREAWNLRRVLKESIGVREHVDVLTSSDCNIAIMIAVVFIVHVYVGMMGTDCW